MAESLRVAIEEATQIAEARRHAVKMAHSLGFNESLSGQVAIVVTEACTNILKHATRGEVLLTITGDDSGRLPDLELLALDQGPGMRNLEQCLADGYTTGSTPGGGLGAIQRLSSESDFYSLPGEGTAILARWFVNAPPPADGLQVGAVNVAKRGQDICGDSWGMEQTGKFSTVLVADGLGHGHEASVASREAVRALRSHPDVAAQALIEFSHQALRSSRGAAVAAARIDRVNGQLAFSGVGNIMAQTYSGAQPGQHLVSVNGTAGHQTQRIREFIYPWQRDSMLVLHSDGLSTSTGLHNRPGLAFRDPSLIAGVLYRDFARGLDDATVVVAREN